MQYLSRATILFYLFMTAHLFVKAQTDGIFPCNRPMVLDRCNYIPNASFDLTDPFITTNSAFSTNNVAGWYDTHGSTDINRYILPFDPDVNFASMGISTNSTSWYSEGIAAKIPALTQGKTYAFSFFIASTVPTGFTAVENVKFNVALINCQNFEPPQSAFPGTLPSPNQFIFCEDMGTIGNTGWRQIFVKFVATGNFDMIRIYPSQVPFVSSATASFVHFALPELVEVTDFTAGVPVYENFCELTITPGNCGVRNAQYTWRDPNNNIVQQGPNQFLFLNMANNPYGTYTLTMTVPGVSNTNNTCSDNNPTIMASVDIVGNCSCTGQLSIENAQAVYLSQFTGPWYTQNLSTCTINNLCNRDELIEISATSNQTNGNVWEVLTNSFTGNQFQFYSSWGGNSTNPVATTQNLDLQIVFDPSGYGEVEIKLTNTILNISKSMIIRIIPTSYVFDVCYSNDYPGYKKFIGGTQNPYTNYMWTFPTGMTLLPNPNVLLVSYNESQYTGTYPINATLVATSLFGCPTNTQPLTLYSAPIYCNAKTLNENNLLYKQEEIRSEETFKNLTISPNPANGNIRISSTKNIKSATILNAQGVALKQLTQSQALQAINISDLKPGTYFIKVFYSVNEYEVKTIIKQ